MNDPEELPYCGCCGRLKSDIQKELYKVPYDDRDWREWEKHKQKKGNSYFYDSNYLKNCENCGKELDYDTEVQTDVEFVGMIGSTRALEERLIGYACSKCGYKEEF